MHQLLSQTPHCTDHWPTNDSQRWITCPGWHKLETANSSTPRLLKAHHRTFLGTRFQAFSKSTRTTRTPAFWGYPPPPNDYPYHWVILDPKSKEDKVKVTNLKNSPKFQIFEFWNGHYTRHTFWSCLIRCANMKWIRWVLLKISLLI